MEYFVTGKITIEIDMDRIEADSLEDAKNKAIEMCKDYYNLDVVNAHHDSEKLDIDLDANEYDED